MLEQRRADIHRQRLADALRDEIVATLEGELGDPRIGLVTVSEVRLAPDGKSAHVLVAVAGDEKEAARTLEGLEAARGYIRHEIRERLRLRHDPDSRPRRKADHASNSFSTNRSASVSTKPVSRSCPLGSST